MKEGEGNSFRPLHFQPSSPKCSGKQYLDSSAGIFANRFHQTPPVIDQAESICGRQLDSGRIEISRYIDPVVQQLEN